jgi:hypothetical protein
VRNTLDVLYLVLFQSTSKSSRTKAGQTRWKERKTSLKGKKKKKKWRIKTT